jgi:hypothetical protein
MTCMSQFARRHLANSEKVVVFTEGCFFKRGIRNIFNQLENARFIVRKDGKTKEENGKPNFLINTRFVEGGNVFNLNI